MQSGNFTVNNFAGEDRKMKPSTTLLVLVLTLSTAITVSAQDIAIDPDGVTLGKPEYSPFLNRGYPQQVFWGDTHVHTSYSTDAGMLGNRLGLDEAYRFARGEIVTASSPH